MKGWSREEVEATVSDYFAMLEAELRGRSYSKTEHRRRLLPNLHGRSVQSVEFKHANISAILIDLGFPYIAGYKPRSNYQRLLYEVVADRLASDGRLVQLAADDVEATATLPSVDDILGVLTAPPARAERSSRERRTPAGAVGLLKRSINYLERESRNRALGLVGEQFVIRFEQARLIHAGREALAARIEHVSRTRGDGDGYDILSYEESGKERLVEVKTTKYGRETPFFVSQNEVEVSGRLNEQYHIYRVFDFRSKGRLFMLHGAIADTCQLEPVSYAARVA